MQYPVSHTVLLGVFVTPLDNIHAKLTRASPQKYYDKGMVVGAT